MKTQLYYPHVEIKAIGLVIALSSAFLFSLKAQESTLGSFTAGSYAPNNSLTGATNDSVTEAGNAQLAAELKSMMSSGSYWSNDEVNQNENLTEMLGDWMKNGLYWKESQKNTDDDFSAEPIAANDGE
jgi:hypothetical protein